MGNVTAEIKPEPEPSKFSYLDILASIGSAKHIGGKGATDILLKEANIAPGSFVLDVGCGMGKTSSKLAREKGCRVISIDLMPQMIKESRRRASQLGVGDQISFIRCDAKSLPFKPGIFDSVIVESVTIFVEDVEKAIEGYYNVVKKGGYVCDNEVCVTREALNKMDDRLDDLRSVFTAFGSTTNKGMLTFEDWKELFDARFGNVKSSHHLIDLVVETETRQEDGFRSFVAAVKSMLLYFSNPEARRIMDEGKKMMYFKDDFGYGLYVSRK